MVVVVVGMEGVGEGGRRRAELEGKTVLFSCEEEASDHLYHALLSTAFMVCLSPTLHPPPLQSIVTLWPVPSLLLP